MSNLKIGVQKRYIFWLCNSLPVARHRDIIPAINLTNNSANFSGFETKKTSPKISANFWCTCCLGWQEGMRDCGLFPYFFPYADDTIWFLWYLMNNYRKISELNDTQSGILATNGQRQPNSNPSSSAIRFTPDSSESRGFFLFSPLLRFRLFWISEADFCFPLRFPLSAYGLDKGLHPVCTVFLHLFGHVTVGIQGKRSCCMA